VIQTWGEDLNGKPAETLDAYVRAFESLDSLAVASFYHLPCMFIVPGGVALISDSDAARDLASKLIEQARSQDYRRTEILNLEVKTLAEPLALLSGVFARFNSNEEEMSRFAFVYTMRRDGTGWRIVVAIAHEAPAAQT